MYSVFSGITCQCKNITTLEGYGNCLKPSNKHNDMLFCYVIQPSSCSDLKDDDAFNGEKLSAEACKSQNWNLAEQLPPQKGYVTFYKCLMVILTLSKKVLSNIISQIFVNFIF